METLTKQFTTDNAVYDCIIAKSNEIITSITANIIEQVEYIDEEGMPIHKANSVGTIIYNGDITTRGIGSSEKISFYLDDFVKILESLKTNC